MCSWDGASTRLPKVDYFARVWMGKLEVEHAKIAERSERRRR